MPKFATKAVLSVVDNFEWKMVGWVALKEGKWSTLFISNEDMDDVIRIINSIEHSSLSIDGVTETVKYEKKTRRQRQISKTNNHTQYI